LAGQPLLTQVRDSRLHVVVGWWPSEALHSRHAPPTATCGQALANTPATSGNAV